MIKGNVDNGDIDDLDERREHYGESNNPFIHKTGVEGPRVRGSEGSSVVFERFSLEPLNPWTLEPFLYSFTRMVDTTDMPILRTCSVSVSLSRTILTGIL
jgi:hypothetical protein